MSDTIARLQAMRAREISQAAEYGSDRLLDLPDFGSNPGTLRAKYHLPDNLQAGAPLVVVLHGCTQNAGAYDRGAGWSELAQQAGCALLYPEQQRANNPNLCFNWFTTTDAKRDSGEALSIRQMIETLVVAHGLDRKRIFVTGLSAGGAMASVMLATYPEVFAGGAIIAGLPYGSARTVPEAFDRMRGHGGPSEQTLQQLLRGASRHEGRWPRISVWHGSADRTVAPSNAEAIIGQWRGVHGLDATPTIEQANGGHARRVWRNADGTEMLEAHMIAGMAHGTPLHTKGEDGYGAPGPYMLDVGISSTRHIADFWGIAPSATADARPRRQNPKSGPSPLRSHVPSPGGTTEAPNAPTVTGIRKTIEEALRGAGLLR